MPQSITIAAFVLGAVLLLIGLLGGGFKIFGAEVSGNTGRVSRGIAGAIGVVMIVIGLVGSLGSSPTAGPPNNDSTTTTERPADSRERSSPRAEPVSPRPDGPRSIAGQWRDETGTVYGITQSGSDFTFQGYNSSTGVGTRGTGHIVGRQLTATFQVGTPNGPASGTGRGSVSEDGRMMTGMFSDSFYGNYSHTLERID
jgi:hypothetical protein